MEIERLTVRVPKGWKATLDAIGRPMERDRSYLTRKALEQTYPQLTKLPVVASERK